MADRERSALWGAMLVVGAVLVAGCSGPAGGTQRPSDPHELAAAAVRATAALSTARLHVELTSSSQMQDFQNPNNPQLQQMRTSITIDADVDLVNRQLAGHEAMAITAPSGLGIPAAPNADIIVTTTDTFTRMNGQGKWMQGGGGLSGGPTNGAIATAIIGVLDDGGVTYERQEAVECSLGTCDHLIVHVPSRAVAGALALLSGQPGQGDAMAAMLPDVDVDARIDQATVLISEIRFEIAVAASQTSVMLAISNPGQPVQIVRPAPGLVESFGDNTGGGVVIGGEATPMPISPEESPGP